MKRILVTGAAGFIGYHVCMSLLKEEYEIIGLDIINNYYDVNIKFGRLKNLGINKKDIKINKIVQSKIYTNFHFIKSDIAEKDFVLNFMLENKFSYVINLAAQAGVRYSIDNPWAYSHSNLTGFLSILEGARMSKVEHLIYASTSSVYGLNSKMPLKESMTTSHPMALYAATKRSNELMAHSYSHLYGISTTGVRFFTVYGPWGRPDMALFLFTNAIYKNKPINVYNHGKMVRDFTYVDDIVESLIRLIKKPAKKNSKWNSESPAIDSSSSSYRIFNIGNGSPVKLMDYISELEKCIGKKAKINMMPMQPGDVAATHADTSSLESYIKFKPNTLIKDGIRNFINWYNEFYFKK